MRFLIAPEFYEEMRQRSDHTADCYVRPGEYLHHLYVDGVKYVIAPAMLECLAQACEVRDEDAIRHLELHKAQYDVLLVEAMQAGGIDGVVLLGDPPPEDDGSGGTRATGYAPQQPRTLSDTGLNITFLFDLILRVIYNAGRITGSDLAAVARLPFAVLAP